MHGQTECRYSMEVLATEERMPRIRRILAAHLRHWDLEAQIDPVCRAVDALIANVVRHVPGDPTCLVELRWTGRRINASVADRDPRMPRMTSSCPARGGLATVAQLSDSWGTCGTGDGKVIWFTRTVTSRGRVPGESGRDATLPPVGEARPRPERAAGQFREAIIPTVSSPSTTQPNQSQPLLPSATV
ncbi:ATP-binding protein [Streptomyces sp. NPDC020875]|uniref:ATP-binding protein n=1 Tax=Streptomyces sp. NPDC020875 TaxID=3154898 RepID=UPI0033FD7DEA